MSPPIDRRLLERRRSVRAASNRRRRRWAGSAVALVLLAGVGFGLTRSPLFAVDEVRVEGAAGAAADVVLAAAGIRRGINLMAVDLEVAAAAVERLPWVATAEARRVPPSAVVVEVLPREPAAVVRLATTAWVVDAEGVVLAPGLREDLVPIDAPGSVLPGVGEQAIDAAVRNALEVLSRLPGPLRASLVRLDAPSERGLRLLVDVGDVGAAATDPAAPEGADGDGGGVLVRFGTAEESEAKAQVVGVLLDQVRQARLVDDGPAVSGIDVRVPENPVLVTAPAGGA